VASTLLQSRQPDLSKLWTKFWSEDIQGPKTMATHFAYANFALRIETLTNSRAGTPTGDWLALSFPSALAMV